MTAPDLRIWMHHYQDEADAAYLYGVLASAEPDRQRREIYAQLADVERRHTDLWAKLLRDHGHPIRPGGRTSSLQARTMAWLARRFGTAYLLPLLLREEGREVKGYLDLHRRTSPSSCGINSSLRACKSIDFGRHHRHA